jgi:hypothetical protein
MAGLRILRFGLVVAGSAYKAQLHRYYSSVSPLAWRVTPSWFRFELLVITESGKVISKTSVEHVIRNDYLCVDTKLEIETFNTQLTASLDDANFIVDGEGEFDSLYLQDIDDDLHSGIRRAEDETTPTPADYGDMHTDDQPDEDDDEEAVDNYLNVELIMNRGTNDERRGRVVKRSRVGT